MRFLSKKVEVFEFPYLTQWLLLIANVVAFLICVLVSDGRPDISPAVLLRFGALHSKVLVDGEYWRLVAYAFLHANPLHLVSNMICLISWGGLLEKRVGAFNFILIYVAAIVAGGVVSVLGHSAPFIGVGASGGISGLVGALLGLWVLGRIGLAAQFFIVIIGLNAALMASEPRIDGWNHIGGFAGGLICCALIDLQMKANNLVFRCKIPDFVMIDATILSVIFGIWIWAAPIAIPIQDSRMRGLLAIAAAIIAVKLFDIVLSVRKGMAIVVVILAAFFAVVPLLFRGEITWALNRLCAFPRSGLASWAERLPFRVDDVCQSGDAVVYAVMALLFGIVILVHRAALVKGIADVGFTSATLRAERDRCRGI